MEHTCHVPRGMRRMARATWHKVRGLEHGLDSAAMTGESLVREVDSRIGQVTARVPQTGRLCMHEKSMHG